MTRVLGITNMYPPHHYGGYELICRDVLDRFEERGHQTSMLTTTMRVPGVADPADEADHRIWRHLRFAWDDHELLNPGPLRRVQDERHNQRALAQALDVAQPDVVSVWNMGAMSLGLLETLRRRDIPVVLNLCDDWLVYGPRLDPWTRLFADRRPVVGRLAETLTGVPALLPDLSWTTPLYISEFTRDRALQDSRMRPGRGAVTWSGIDERDFPLTDRATTGAVPPWGWRLLGVGRIDDRKGIEVAVRALTDLPDESTLVWLGQGEAAEMQRLESLARDLGVGHRVTWGSAPRDELPLAYANADVFVFPSTWDEPFGLVPIEAMACGVPVIGSGTGGSAEFLIDGVTALLAAPGDPSALAAAVRALESSPSLRARLVAGGAKVARELTIGRLTEVIEAWHVGAAHRFVDGKPAPRTLSLT